MEAKREQTYYSSPKKLFPVLVYTKKEMYKPQRSSFVIEFLKEFIHGQGQILRNSIPQHMALDRILYSDRGSIQTGKFQHFIILSSH